MVVCNCDYIVQEYEMISSSYHLILCLHLNYDILFLKKETRLSFYEDKLIKIYGLRVKVVESVKNKKRKKDIWVGEIVGTWRVIQE